MIRASTWSRLGTRLLPFADAASAELPLGRLLRLSLFQVSVGMSAVLLTGTLNRVMIVELGIGAALVATLVALPLLFAPARALIGFRSDHHRSALGWKRVPYLWFGSLLQFGGLAIMPFALLVTTGEGQGPAWVGIAGAALAFLLVGAGMHTTQTAGLALATDLAPPESRPRVVALLYVTLLAGMMLAALVIGVALRDFSPTRLIQVIQGAAALTMVLNLVALWKQEARNPAATRADGVQPSFLPSWRAFAAPSRTRRLLLVVALGAAGFNMQDVLLEPYGGEVLGLGVGQTTMLTALWASGMLGGFMLAARWLGREDGGDPFRLAALGALAGIAAFSLVIFSAPAASVWLFAAGVVGIGLGGGLFGVAMLIAAMGLADGARTGLALGAWGAVQASAVGLGIMAAGIVRDIANEAAASGALGEALAGAATGYLIVWHIEIALLFATLIALGPLARRSDDKGENPSRRFGLAEFPA
jgi:BCD family chlorophyll transporter-like MFS transporter